jgi:hypothetical protein
MYLAMRNFSELATFMGRDLKNCKFPKKRCALPPHSAGISCTSRTAIWAARRKRLRKDTFTSIQFVTLSFLLLKANVWKRPGAQDRHVRRECSLATHVITCRNTLLMATPGQLRALDLDGGDSAPAHVGGKKDTIACKDLPGAHGVEAVL